MYTRSAVFRRTAGSEPVLGGGRAFRRNTVTSLRKPDACRTLADEPIRRTPVLCHRPPIPPEGSAPQDPSPARQLIPLRHPPASPATEVAGLGFRYLRVTGGSRSLRAGDERYFA